MTALQFPGGSVPLSTLTSATPERSTSYLKPAPALVTESDVEELDLVDVDHESDPGLDGPYTVYALLAGDVQLGTVTHYESTRYAERNSARVELVADCDEWARDAIRKHVRTELGVREVSL